MKKRFNMGKVQPEAYAAMDALDQYLTKTAIDQKTQELIRVRASQINGCAYCVNYHTEEAIKHGEAWQRLHLLSAWRESGDIFSEEERLMLKMTEEISLIHHQGLTEETYEDAINTFGIEKTAQIIMVIVTINAWNRIGVSLRMNPILNTAVYSHARPLVP
jgi:AhpD family alkylhydroperoxidase